MVKCVGHTVHWGLCLTCFSFCLFDNFNPHYTAISVIVTPNKIFTSACGFNMWGRFRRRKTARGHFCYKEKINQSINQNIKNGKSCEPLCSKLNGNLSMIKINLYCNMTLCFSPRKISKTLSLSHYGEQKKKAKRKNHD